MKHVWNVNGNIELMIGQFACLYQSFVKLVIFAFVWMVGRNKWKCLLNSANVEWKQTEYHFFDQNHWNESGLKCELIINTKN